MTTKYHAKYFAHELTKQGGIGVERLSRSLFDACVDLNPHQIEAASFAINEIQAQQGNLVESSTPAYTEPLTVEFLKTNPYMVVDTKYFNIEFKHRLLAPFDNFEDQLCGLLIDSDNFQALNILQERYKEQIECVHIDPPYNTATSGFLYKNEYQHSSWMALMRDRIAIASELLTDHGAFQCHIDENEYESLYHIFDTINLPDAG